MGKSQNTKTSLLNSRRKQQNSTLEISLRQSRRKSSPWTRKGRQRPREEKELQQKLLPHDDQMTKLYLFILFNLPFWCQLPDNDFLPRILYSLLLISFVQFEII